MLEMNTDTTKMIVYTLGDATNTFLVKNFYFLMSIKNFEVIKV